MKELKVIFKAVSAGYGKIPVLNDVNLEIQKGDFVGVIGPNGSGKTTLLRTISRILRPSKGRIIIDNENIWDSTQKEMARKIAVVSQSIEPFGIQVIDYVEMGRIPYYKRMQFFSTRDDITITEKYLIKTDTYILKDKMLSEISGGERQLVQIARALTQEPAILLLDEPVSHLDIHHKVKILDLMRKLNRSLGLTIIIVLHDLNFAGEYCNRLVLMNHGKIYKMGSVEEVLDYKVIEDVYKIPVVIEKNRVSGKPYVIPVSEEIMKESLNKKYDLEARIKRDSL